MKATLAMRESIAHLDFRAWDTYGWVGSSIAESSHLLLASLSRNRVSCHQVLQFPFSQRRAMHPYLPRYSALIIGRWRSFCSRHHGMRGVKAESENPKQVFRRHPLLARSAGPSAFLVSHLRQMLRSLFPVASSSRAVYQMIHHRRIGVDSHS